MQSKWKTMILTAYRVGGSRNMLKYTRDESQRKELRSGRIGVFIVIVLSALFMFVLGTTMMFSGSQNRTLVPSMGFLAPSIFILVFGIFRMSSSLFMNKDYSLLGAMPVTDSMIVGSKLIVEYLSNLGITMLMNVPVALAYCIFGKINLGVLLLWIFLTLFVPFVPMTIAVFFAGLIARVSSGMKHKKVVQAFFQMLFSVMWMGWFLVGGNSSQFFNILGKGVEIVNRVYPLADFFSSAIVELKVGSMLLFIVISILFAVLGVMIVGKFYFAAHSVTGRTSRKKETEYKGTGRRSKRSALILKEWRSFMGHSTLLANVGAMCVVSIGIAIASNVVDLEHLFGEGVSVQIWIPISAVVIYYFIGLAQTTVSSYSLEGKQLWIVRSMPISVTDLAISKMLFQLMITVPVTVVSTGLLAHGLGATWYQGLVLIQQGVAFCLYSATFGMRCGLKYPKLSWENEAEAIKRGRGNTIYAFVHIFLTLGIAVIQIVAGIPLAMKSDVLVTAMIFCVGVLVMVLALWSYISVMKIAKDME